MTAHAMDVLFREDLTLDTAPAWPCPNCGAAALALLRAQFHCMETAHSLAQRQMDGWTPDCVQYRCSGLLRCSACGDTVAMAGDGGVEAEDDGVTYVDFFSPRYFHPALPLTTAQFRHAVPAAVQQALQRAFGQFWSAPRACHDAMQAALQAMLDGQGFPDARLAGAMDEFKRMMETQMWLPQGGAPGTGMPRRSDILRGFAWLDGWLGELYPPLPAPTE